MNTANLQMEATAIAEIVVRKGLVSHTEVEKASACVEDSLLLDRSAGLSKPIGPPRLFQFECSGSPTRRLSGESSPRLPSSLN